MNKEYLEVSNSIYGRILSSWLENATTFLKKTYYLLFLFLQEQAAKEALAAELAARGIVVEEGKKKVRNTFGQSNFLFTILSWFMWLSVAVFNT